MTAIFLHTFKKYRGQILGWGLSLAALGGFLLAFYDTLADQSDQMMGLIEQYPPEMFAFFGDMNKLFTPGGYIHTEFFSYMPIILGFFSILAGASLLAGDEENGTLDLVLAHPVSRVSLFMGRLLAYLAATLAILLITWLGFIAVEPATDIGIQPFEMALPFLSMFSLLLVFGTLALLLSMILPSARTAASVAAVTLIASFFLSSFARIQPDLEAVSKFSPMNYYQGGEAISGLNWGWFFALLGISLLFTLGGLLAFQRKDIRVGGEGSLDFVKLTRNRVPNEK